MIHNVLLAVLKDETVAKLMLVAATKLACNVAFFGIHSEAFFR